jgi:hypothetical protein
MSLQIKNLSPTSSVDIVIITFHTDKTITITIMPNEQFNMKTTKKLHYIIASIGGKPFWEGPIPVTKSPVVVDPYEKCVSHRSLILPSVHTPANMRIDNNAHDDYGNIIIIAIVLIIIAAFIYFSYKR